MTTLSVIIITKNEAHNIESCLRSISFADEIIVLDSGSTDNTVELARRYTDKVQVTDWPGYGIQKERARLLATSDWILSLDADEAVTPALQREIQTTLKNKNLTSKYDAFEILFRSEYCGKLIRFGDWWNDRQAVLFKKNKGSFSTDAIHERINLTARIGRLKHYIYHKAFPNPEIVIRKMNDYSSYSANHKKNQGKKSSMYTAISHAIWTFIRGYIIRLGFLDGKQGFMLAVSNAEGTYYRYVKLMFLH